MDTIAKCDDVIEFTENVEDEVFYMSFNITNKLKPSLNSLEADGEVSLNTARDLSKSTTIKFFFFKFVRLGRYLWFIEIGFGIIQIVEI